MDVLMYICLLLVFVLCIMFYITCSFDCFSPLCSIMLRSFTYITLWTKGLRNNHNHVHAGQQAEKHFFLSQYKVTSIKMGLHTSDVHKYNAHTLKLIHHCYFSVYNISKLWCDILSRGREKNSHLCHKGAEKVKDSTGTYWHVYKSGYSSAM